MTNAGVLIGVIVVAAFMVASGSAGVQHRVGNENGWSLRTNFTAWTLEHHIHVDDTLLFEYNYPQLHNVLLLSPLDWALCNVNPTKEQPPLFMDESGYTIFGPLQQAGVYHFTCGGADHCDEGMKLGVYVRLLPGHPSEATPTPPDLDYPTPPPIDTPDLDYPTPPPIDYS